MADPVMRSLLVAGPVPMGTHLGDPQTVLGTSLDTAFPLAHNLENSMEMYFRMVRTMTLSRIFDVCSPKYLRGTRHTPGPSQVSTVTKVHLPPIGTR